MSTTDPTIRLRDLAERGVGFDMNPTMMFDSMESLWQQWRAYFGHHDEAWRGQMRVILDAFERVEAARPALSTPPADDVREALAELLMFERDKQPRHHMDIGSDELADAILTAFEVRPRGTVTDAEVLRAKAAALTEFADAVRMPFTVFRGDNEEPITPGDLMRETAARYLAEAAREARS